MTTVDAFGKQTKITKVKSATLVNLSNGKTQDMTGKIQMQDENLVVLFDNILDLQWASYALHLTLSTPQTANVFNVYRFDIKAEIFSKVLVSLS